MKTSIGVTELITPFVELVTSAPLIAFTQVWLGTEQVVRIGLEPLLSRVICCPARPVVPTANHCTPASIENRTWLADWWCAFEGQPVSLYSCSLHRQTGRRTSSARIPKSRERHPLAPPVGAGNGHTAATFRNSLGKHKRAPCWSDIDSAAWLLKGHRISSRQRGSVV